MCSDANVIHEKDKQYTKVDDNKKAKVKSNC